MHYSISHEYLVFYCLNISFVSCEICGSNRNNVSTRSGKVINGGDNLDFEHRKYGKNRWISRSFILYNFRYN